MPAVGIWDGSQWQPIQGLQGIDGADGADGATGPQGDKGDQGDPGIPGPSSVSSDSTITGILTISNVGWLATGSVVGNNGFGLGLTASFQNGDGVNIATNEGSVAGFFASGIDFFKSLTMQGNTLINWGSAWTIGPDPSSIIFEFKSAGITYIQLDSSGGGTVSVVNKKITNLATPTATTDATNKTYVDGRINTRLALTGGTMSGILTIARINGSGVGSQGGLLIVGGDLNITTAPSTTTSANAFRQANDGRIYVSTSLAIHKDNVVPLTPAAAETFIGAFDGVEYDSLLDPRSNVGFIAEHAEIADPRINSVRDLSEPLAGIQDRVIVAYHHTALQDLYARVAALEP